MKVTYQTCCGVDVHKTFFVATIIKTTGGVEPSYQKKRFSTFNSDIRHFKQWLLDNNCFDVCMESTGKYWIPVFNLLEDRINVMIANPKWVKAVKGNKDDEKDSKWIGDLFRLGLARGSFIPCKEIRILREFTRYRFKLVSCRTSEKNRFQNAFTVCNVALDSVVTDMFGVSASAITDYLITTDTFDAEICKSFLKGTLKGKADAVVESIDAKLDDLVTPYEEAIALLCTIPGIDRASAITIISEIGTDMSQFDSSKRLCCWAGLTPGSNASAGKKKSVRITRAGVYLKPALVQCAHAAVKSLDSPYYKSKYERLLKRRGKKRAIIAIARMILTAVYHMLSTGETWNPCDLFKIDMPQEMQDKQKAKAIKQALKFLRSEGVISPSDILIESV